MRRVLAVPFLAPLLVLAAAPRPVGANGMLPEDSIFSLSIRVFEEIFEDDVELDDRQRFAGSFAFAAAVLAGGQVTIDLDADPDPVLDFTLSIDNLAARQVFVTYSFLMPIVAIGAGSQVSASLDVVATDANGVGNAFVGTLNPTIQQAFVSEDGVSATSLGVDLGVGVAAPGAFFSSGPLPGPAPDPVLGPAFTLLVVNGGFSLSAGDSAALTGNVTLTPEPGAVWLLLGGLAGLAWTRRRK
jgi:hypothetical protein